MIMKSGTVNRQEEEKLNSFTIRANIVRATLNCYLWTCTRAVPKIQVKASWAHTKTKTRLKEWMSANSL